MYLLTHLQKLPQEDYIELTYEDLCADPETEMDRIYAFLRRPAPADVSYDDVSPREQALQPDVAGYTKTLRKRAQEYYRHYGYSSTEVAIAS